MKRREDLECFHEPFGEAFYYGPESLSKRYENDPAAREASGQANTTYLDTLSQILEAGEKEVRAARHTSTVPSTSSTSISDAFK